MTLIVKPEQLATLGGAEAIQECPLNWVEIRYLYVDGTPVGGACYTVKDSSGALLASAQLDANGWARVDLPKDVAWVAYSFHDDPDILEIRIKPQPHGQKAEAGWLERMGGHLAAAWDAVTGVGRWIWGAIQGDFNEDPTFGQIVLNTILTLIPVVDQIGDLRDLVANLKLLIWDKKYKEYAVWVALFFTLVGLIPELGSLLKGVLKAIWKGATGIGWEGLLKVFNYFAKGNGAKWLERLRAVKLDEVTKQVSDKLKEILQAIKLNLQKLKGYLPRFMDDALRKIDDVLKSVDEVLARIDEMFRRISDELKQKLDDILGRKKRLESVGPSKTTNTHQQESLRPKTREERLDDLAQDPAHRGKDPSPKTRREAEVGMALEEQGVLKGPIKRDPNPAGGEFIDADGKVWDVKTFNSNYKPRDGGFSLDKDVAKIEKELGKGEGVILDTKDLSAEHLEQLREAVTQKGWTNDQVLWFPP